MAEGKFKPGDRVSWNSHGSTAEGTVVHKITADIEGAGRTVRASEDEPQFLVHNEDSGGEAVHRPSVLTRLPKD